MKLTVQSGLEKLPELLPEILLKLLLTEVELES